MATQKATRKAGYGVERITPPMAKEWLKKNERNRPLRRTIVSSYADAMRSREWKLNYDPIRFNGDGGLIDGQHRLAAVVESGVSINSLVVRGMSDETFSTFDQGLRRTVSDIMALSGEQYYAALGSALRWMWLIKSGKKGRIRAVLAEKILADNPGLRESLKFVVQEGFNALWSAGTAATLYYLMSQKDKKLATDFFHRLGSGEDLKKGEPLWHLRNSLLRNRNKFGATRFTQDSLVTFCIRAWNSYRTGEFPKQRHRIVKGEPRPEIE